MSSCVRRNLDFLKIISEAKPKARYKIIKACSTDNLKALTEIAYNTVHGIVKLKADQKHRLKRHRIKIKNLAKLKKSFKTKKAELLKGAGFLPHLLNPIIQILTGVGASLIANLIV